jgi:exodeoxyribonuclease VII large subunit
MKLIYEKKKDRLGLLSEGLTQKMNIVYERKRSRFSVLVAQLNGLSPTAKLVQGFGYISSKDKPVRSIEDVSKGDTVDIRIHDGHIITTVNETAGL